MHSKPEAKNLDYKLTAESRRRVIPNLKKLYDLMNSPGIISLAGGTPNYSIFPFDGVGSTSLSPPFADGIAEPKMENKNSFHFKVFERNGETSDDGGTDIELASALQYGPAVGDDLLRDFLKEHVSAVQDIGFADWDLILTVGNTYAWDTVLRTFCEPTDVLLFEEFTFPSALETAQTRGCGTFGVKIDEHGIDPDDLELKAQQYRPKLLYTIPTGQNPTGSVLPAKRREKVMEIARKYDFLVVEDEPYYYLQMDSADGTPLTGANDRSKIRQQFVSSLVPSFLHFDTDGRVIRLDSFSKIMAPGIRMGWITAQKRFTEALRKTMESSSSKPSGFAQALVYGVLRRWGQPGLLDWLIGLKQEYTERRNICCETLLSKIEDPESRVSLTLPEAGMFFWLTITYVGDPKDVGQLEDDLFTQAGETRKVLVVPGNWCKVEKTNTESVIHFRGTFASESKDALAAGAERLAHAVNDFLVSTKAQAEASSDERCAIEPYTIVNVPSIIEYH